jgi:hypothetical protein
MARNAKTRTPAVAGELKLESEMSIDPNTPAFPALYGQTNGADGLTKREYFAALAMQGLCANSIPGSHRYFQMMAIDAVAHADALIAELARR